MGKYKYLLKNKKENLKRINIGIQLLRMMCCLLIILVHFYRFYHYPILKQEYVYYIMIFFFISFYFSYNTLSSRNIPKIKERFKRMIVPYIGWPLVFFIKDKVYHYFYNNREMYNFKNLYYQILIGCGIYGIFWYIFNLIFISLFFTLIIFIFKNHFIFVLFLFCITNYSLYYSHYASNHFFNKFKRVPVSHSILPIIIYFHFAFTGFYCASINLIHKIVKCREIFFIISIAFILIFLKFYFFIFKSINFFYIGIMKSIFVLNIFIFFSIIPFDKIKNKNVMVILNKLTSYTGGIYYLHVKIGDLGREYINLNKKDTFQGCLLIYLFCYLICFICSFILKKSNLKYLFA